MPNKRMPAAERQRDSRRTGCHSKAVVAGNRPDAGRAAGPERELTWAGEPVKYRGRAPGEPRGKLDTITVNGPEDVLNWDAIDWRAHEQNVARLRRRIFTATREQDWATVRSLQNSPATPPGLA